MRCFQNILTFLVMKLDCTEEIRPMPWLLMPWHLASPGHQQPWYWLCRIKGSSSSTTEDFNYLCRSNMHGHGISSHGVDIQHTTNGSLSITFATSRLKVQIQIHFSCFLKQIQHGRIKDISRVDPRFAPSQWETALLRNDVSDWLGASPVTWVHLVLLRYDWWY